MERIIHNFSAENAQQITFYKQCPECDTVHEFIVNADQYNNWRAGKHIQFVWPNVSADDRETMISGYCGPCFDSLFE